MQWTEDRTPWCGLFVKHLVNKPMFRQFELQAFCDAQKPMQLCEDVTELPPIELQRKTKSLNFMVQAQNSGKVIIASGFAGLHFIDHIHNFKLEEISITPNGYEMGGRLDYLDLEAMAEKMQRPSKTLEQTLDFMAINSLLDDMSFNYTIPDNRPFYHVFYKTNRRGYKKQNKKW